MDRSNYGLALAVALSPVGVVLTAMALWLATDLTNRSRTRVWPVRRGFHSLVGAGGGFLVIAGWALGLLAQLAADPFDAPWWGGAVPMVGAVVTAAAFALWTIRHPVLVERPVIPVVRRTWTSFADRWQLGIFVGSATLLTGLTVVCGVMSEPGVDGSANITFVGPSGGYSTTYGWATGLPVVLLTFALIGLVCYAMYLDAARPFARAETVDSDTRMRSGTVSTLLGVTVGASLLTLGSVVVGLADSAVGSVGLQVPGSTDPYVWGPGYSSLAPALTWAGWIAQVVGVLYLLRVMAAPFRHQSDSARRIPVAAQR